MELDEIRNKINLLEKEIANLINNFQEDTDTLVDNISMSKRCDPNEPVKVGIILDVNIV